MLVGKALGLDVTGPVEVALHEALAAAERGDGFADGRVEQLRHLLQRPGDLEAPAATTEGSLDRDGQAVLLGEGDDLLDSVDRVGGTGDERGPGALGDVASAHLVAERLDGGRWGTDPGQAGVDDGLGEARVLGEEAIAGVDGIGA